MGVASVLRDSYAMSMDCRRKPVPENKAELAVGVAVVVLVELRLVLHALGVSFASSWKKGEVASLSICLTVSNCLTSHCSAEDAKYREERRGLVLVQWSLDRRRGQKIAGIGHVGSWREDQSSAAEHKGGYAIGHVRKTRSNLMVCAVGEAAGRFVLLPWRKGRDELQRFDVGAAVGFGCLKDVLPSQFASVQFSEGGVGRRLVIPAVQSEHSKVVAAVMCRASKRETRRKRRKNAENHKQRKERRCHFDEVQLPSQGSIHLSISINLSNLNCRHEAEAKNRNASPASMVPCSGD